MYLEKKNCFACLANRFCSKLCCIKVVFMVGLNKTYSVDEICLIVISKTNIKLI